MMISILSICVKKGGDLVRDRRPPRKFAKGLGKLQFFQEILQHFPGT